MSRQTAQATAAKAAPPRFANANPDRKNIEALAYQLWLERGSPTGTPEHDWLRAEEQLRITVNPALKAA